MAAPFADIAGVIVAGGRATRMGGLDKGLLPVGGRAMIARIRDVLRPALGALALNANGDPARFAALGLPVVADEPGPERGPLAGVLAGLAWARTRAPGARRLLTVPCDIPFPPADLPQRLAEAAGRDGGVIACARSDERTHPLCALWPLDLEPDLRATLAGEPGIGVGRWMFRHPVREVDFAETPVDPFLNVNTPEDLARADALERRLTPPAR